MASIAATERIAAQTVQNRLRHRRAELAARSAVARAMAVIQEATPASVTLNDDWALLGDNGNISFDMGDGSTTFRVQIIDENSLIDVDNETRRLMWRLAHAHGTLLSLLHLVYALTLSAAPGAARARGATGSCNAAACFPSYRADRVPGPAGAGGPVAGGGREDAAAGGRGHAAQHRGAAVVRRLRHHDRQRAG